MTAPSKRLRDTVYTRDTYCLSCGDQNNKSFQHREATGSGGRGSKAPKLTPPDGIVLCFLCNYTAEHTGQARALALGHKIRRHRDHDIWPASRIPVFDAVTTFWYQLDSEGGRRAIISALALELIDASGGNTGGWPITLIGDGGVI